VQFMLDNSHLCVPTGFTWTRLMCGYLRQGQHVEAEQIRAVMRKKGIKIGVKEFAFLLENWSESEVVVRAREANTGWRDLDLDGQAEEPDEELFEGLDNRSTSTSTLFDETLTWDGIIDLRNLAEQPKLAT
jgi:pentatricopeptide repeat protein